MAQPLITVVVCTYNRADLLRDCLQSLSEMNISLAEYEVLVVDNNSTDTTRVVVEEFHLQYPNFRYALQSKQGVAHSRNYGWRFATGEYVAYIDDDCKASADWLAVAKSFIESKHPIMFGGPALPFYKSTKPIWFKDDYAIFILSGANIRPTQMDEYFPTMNAIFRKSALELLGGFDTRLGMVGKKIAYGEDTEIMVRLRLEFPEQVIYYVPHLRVYHLVRLEKFSLWWNIKRAMADGYYSFVLFNKQDNPLLLGRWLLDVLKAFLKICKDVLWLMPQRDLTQYPYWENFFYEQICQGFVALGHLQAQAQLFLKDRYAK